MISSEEDNFNSTDWSLTNLAIGFSDEFVDENLVDNDSSSQSKIC